MGNEQEELLQDQLGNLIDLVTNRTKGKLDEERVEAAVSRLLDKAVSKPTTATVSQRNPHEEGIRVVLDEEDYDDIHSDEEGKDGKPQTSSPAVARTDLEWTGPLVHLASLQEPKPPKPPRAKKYSQAKHWELLDRIPLGRMGGKMMVTFGDGSHPDPEACEAALMVSPHPCVRSLIPSLKAYYIYDCNTTHLIYILISRVRDNASKMPFKTLVPSDEK